METEAALVIYFYLGIALILIVILIAVLLFMWMKSVMEDMNIFVRLMVGLYEEEKAKNEKKDGGGFGS